MSISLAEKEYPEIIYAQKCKIVRLEAALKMIRDQRPPAHSSVAVTMLREMKTIASEVLEGI